MKYKKWSLKEKLEILACSEEVGFPGKQGFVAAFKTNTGITPAFFIEGLDDDKRLE